MHVPAASAVPTAGAPAADAVAGTPVARVARAAGGRHRCCLGRGRRVGRAVAATLRRGGRCRRDGDRDGARLTAVAGLGPAASTRTAATSIRALGLRRAAGRLTARPLTASSAAIVSFDRADDLGATPAPWFAPVIEHMRLGLASKASRHQTRVRRRRRTRRYPPQRDARAARVRDRGNGALNGARVMRGLVGGPRNAGGKSGRHDDRTDLRRRRSSTGRNSHEEPPQPIERGQREQRLHASA
jgi:hypothetical protein